MENSGGCERCLLTENYPGLRVDGDGQCNYCAQWQQRWANISYADQKVKLDRILNQARSVTDLYDCIVGLSGGKDSCYVAYYLVKNGMTPLAVTFDNGFMSESAKRNIERIVSTLGMGHVVIGFTRKELRDIYRNFLLHAGEFCSVCNRGITSSLFRIAHMFNIRLIISGQSRRTEANSPAAFFSCSPGYFLNVSKQFMSRKKAKKFIYFNNIKRAYWQAVKKNVFINLPDYLPWKETEMLREMKSELGFEGDLFEQHTDCTMSDVKEYLRYKHFGLTEKMAKLSSLIRDGQLDRDHGMAKYTDHLNDLQKNEALLIDKIKENFDITDDQFEDVVRAEHVAYLSTVDKALGAIAKIVKI